jgi:hypothetical protein
MALLAAQKSNKAIIKKQDEEFKMNFDRIQNEERKTIRYSMKEDMFPDFECFEEEDETMDYSINRIIILEHQHDIDDYFDWQL